MIIASKMEIIRKFGGKNIFKNVRPQINREFSPLSIFPGDFVHNINIQESYDYNTGSKVSKMMKLPFFGSRVNCFLKLGQLIIILIYKYSEEKK